MKSTFILLFLLVGLGMIFVPSFLTAQNSREGNHCAVSKSPFRISMDSGKVVYQGQCMSCHQPDGTGILNLNPPLTNSFVSGDKQKLIGILLGEHASHSELVTNGNGYTIPGNPGLNDLEVAYVLTYIRNSFGNKASSVKESEVRTMRKRMN